MQELKIDDKFNFLYEQIEKLKEMIDLNAVVENDISYIKEHSDELIDEVLSKEEIDEEDYQRLLEEFGL